MVVRALRIVFASSALLAAQNIAMAQNYLSRSVVMAVPNADLSATGSPPMPEPPKAQDTPLAPEQRMLDGISPEYLAKFVAEEIARWAGPINVVGF